MTKKTLVLGVFLLAISSLNLAYAGGFLTNTNQSARFARLFALDAMTNAADAAYYNPAGTALLSEGFHVTFSNQSAFQKRIVKSTFEPYKGAVLGNGSNYKEFVGTASAPIIPSVQGVYKKGKWALSGAISLIGGGGKATFDQGVPLFESGISTLPIMISQLGSQLPAPITLSSQGYSVNQYMSGTNYIFGGQIGGAYQINDMFAVYGGFRLNVVHNRYEGHLKDLKLGLQSENIGLLLGNPTMEDYNGLSNPSAILELAKSQLDPTDLATLGKLGLMQKAAGEGAYLDSKQSGWGVAPILGANFSYCGLNIGVRYEFKTALDIENKTTVDDTGMFAHGVNTANDIPALLTVGASYDVIPQVTVSAGYHHFFDKDASMASDKQNELTGGTNEYLFGAEWRIDRLFTVSAGGQITKFGLSDKFQSDLSFYTSSYSLGCGGAVNVAKNVQINVGYFFTNYDDYKMADVASSPSTTYTRKNKVFTAGVDFSF